MWADFEKIAKNADTIRGKSAEIARLCGVGRPTVTKWKDGTIKTMDIHAFAKYCDALSINMADYIENKNGLDFKYIEKLETENADLQKKIATLEDQLAFAERVLRQPQEKAPAKEALGKDSRYLPLNGTEGE